MSRDVTALSATAKAYLDTVEYNFNENKSTVEGLSYPTEFDNINRLGKDWHAFEINLQSVFDSFPVQESSIVEAVIDNPYKKSKLRNDAIFSNPTFTRNGTADPGSYQIYLADLYSKLFFENDGFQVRLIGEDYLFDLPESGVSGILEKALLVYSFDNYGNSHYSLKSSPHWASDYSSNTSRMYRKKIENQEGGYSYEDRIEYPNMIRSNNNNTTMCYPVFWIKNPAPELQSILLKAYLEYKDQNGQVYILDIAYKSTDFKVINEYGINALLLFDFRDIMNKMDFPILFYDNENNVIKDVVMSYEALYPGQDNDISHDYKTSHASAARNILNIRFLNNVTPLQKCSKIGFILGANCSIPASSLIYKAGRKKGQHIAVNDIANLNSYVYFNRN